MQFDVALFRTINNFAGQSGGLDALGVFTAVFLLPLLGFLLILAAFTINKFKEQHWYELPIKAVVSAGIAYVIRFIVGALTARARPFVALSDAHQLVPMEARFDSFPSGHAALAFALAFTIFKQDRDWGIAFLILALAVAVGRVFVGLHYPLDIIGGAAVGWIAAAVVGWFEKREWSKFERTMRIR